MPVRWSLAAGRAWVPTRIGIAAVAVLSIGLLAGCAALPPEPEVLAVPAPVAASKARVNGAAGPVTPAQRRKALAEARAEGRGPLFEHHVARLSALGETLSSGNRVQLLVDGPATFQAMFRGIDAARERILLESYIFEDTAIGQQMAERLLRKRADGVEVRVIYDGLGAMATPAAFFERLREGGIQVCEFNPLAVDNGRFGLLDANHRDHRKVLVIDDRSAFVGGINISSVYSSGSLGSSGSRRRDADDPVKLSAWRDTHVRLDGPVARELAHGFAATWARQRCGEPPVAAPRLVEFDPVADDRLVLALLSEGDGDSARFYRALLTAIDAAQVSIRITMAYFVPNPQMLEAIEAAARRGVTTELVLPGKSDSTLVLRAGQARYDALLDAGVAIYERDDAFIHAKTAVIDGVWSTVGSSNLDWRSFLHNDEANVVILGRDFGAQMEALFAQDRAKARRVTPEAWARRPLSRRLMEWGAQLWQYWF